MRPMESTQSVLLAARPSMRRAMFYGAIYIALVLYGRIKTDLDPQFNPVWWGCLYVFVGVMGYALLRCSTTLYVITTDEVRRFSGILARKTVIVPINRVTNANADQSILQRILFLVDLRLDCPGGDTKEIFFGLMKKNEAEKAAQILRERMFKGQSASRSDGTGAAANV